MGPVRDDVVPALERSPLFAGFSRAELESVAERLDELSLPAEYGVITEGAHGLEFFLILDGEAEVVARSEVVATLRTGDFFGELAALDGGARTASVRTTTALRCLGLPQQQFRRFLLDHPLFAVNLLQQMLRRFRAVVTSAKGHGGR